MVLLAYTLTDTQILLDWKVQNAPCAEAAKAEWGRVLAFVKSLPNRRYDPNAKRWVVPNNEACWNMLLKVGWVKPLEKPAAPEPIRKTRPWKDDELDENLLIPGMYNYQKDFIRFMGAREGRGVLLDAMGTGKTVQGLAWLRYYDLYPALVVVNASTKLQWEYQWKRWYGTTNSRVPKVEVLKGKTPKKLSVGKSYIINWEILSSWVPELIKIPFMALLGDECQAMSNPDSARGRAFRTMAKQIKNVVGMSGTPARSKPMQFWSIFNLVCPERFPDFWKYKMRYCSPHRTPWGIAFDGASHMDELHNMIADLSLRRTKDEVMSDLPPKTMAVVPMEADIKELEKYEELEKELMESADTKGLEKQEALAKLLNGAFAMKEVAALRWISEFLETGEKLLVFVWHVAVNDDIVTKLSEYNPAQIGGGRTDKEKQKEKFIKEDSCRVLVANIAAGGVGIDGLQDVCSHCCFLEFSATPTDHWQAEDRLHRGGQTRPVTCYYLIAPNTVDEDMVKALDRKAAALTKAVDGKDVDAQYMVSRLWENRKTGFYAKLGDIPLDVPDAK